MIGVDSPADGQLAIDLASGSERLGSVDAAAPGEAIAYEAVLGPGDYVLMLSPIVPSEERYAVTIETADPFDVPDDAEPNDTAGRARPMPADLTAAARSRRASATPTGMRSRRPARRGRSTSTSPESRCRSRSRRPRPPTNRRPP